MTGKKDNEGARALFHASFGLVTVLLYWANWSRPQTLIYLVPLCLVFLLLDYYRRISPTWNDLVTNTIVVRSVVRPKERTGERLSSATYCLLGAVLVILFFPRPICTLSMLYLAWCDPAARIFGVRFGPSNSSEQTNSTDGVSNNIHDRVRSKKKAFWEAVVDRHGRLWNGKSVAGFLGAFGVGFLITMVFLITTSSHHDILEFSSSSSYSTIWMMKLLHLFKLSVTGGLSGALAEVLALSTLDDNLTMPVLAAIFLSLFSTIEEHFYDAYL